jgi:EmrB/QacA subfamily drug resistance transporter
MNRRIVLLVATIASFITPFMASSVNIALPAIGREFSMSAVLLAWVATAYTLAAAIFLVPFGKLGDIHGRKRVLLGGMAVFTVTTALCGVAPSPTWLVALRVVQGIGGSMVFGTSVAIVTSVIPAHERGRALGITTAAVYTGLSLGPVLGGLLTQHFGWRSVFFASAPLGLLDVILIARMLKGDRPEARGERFDVFGAIAYCVSLGALMYGFPRLTSPAGACLVLAGVAGIAAFVRWERGARNPILHVELFERNRVYAFSNLAALINYSASFAVTFLMSLYLQYIKALTPQAAGLVLVWQPVMMTLFSPFAGRLSDRIESRVVASWGMALTTAALVVFIFLGPGTSRLVIVANLMLLGFGFALFSSPNTNAVMCSVESRLYGVASATLATMRATGQMLSMGIAMLLFAVNIGGAAITPERYGGFLTSVRTAFIIFAILSCAGIFSSLARGNARSSPSLKRAAGDGDR